MLLPFIRQDLKIINGSAKEDGSPSWLLYDSLRHKYFVLTKTTLIILKNWVGGEKVDALIKKIEELKLNIKQRDIEDFIQFLDTNNLIVQNTSEGSKKLATQYKSQKKHWFLKLIHGYLFFKIPIFKPDDFLKKTLPIVSKLGSKLVRNLIYILGLIGIFLVIQEYEKFWNTFSYFYNINGLILFGITIVFVKALHELGHAYVAKNFGCNVSAIGLAMLVFFPFLYTDTTDAWKLKDNRQRLLINFAGMLTELHLALIATFIWAIAPEGIIQSAAFFIASASWVSSLLINISPFMRFDGYYVFSDFLKADNLQPRAFALGRWQIREWIFGFNFDPPEILESSRKWVFIIYAWSTWIYRFFLFIGIALLVYYLAFKVLGIILFLIEIIWFIGLPIYREVKQWWQLKTAITMNKIFIRSILIFLISLTIFFYPWRSSITIPSVYESAHTVDIYPSEEAVVEKVFISPKQFVNKNDNLIKLNSPLITNAIRQSKDRIELLELRLKRRLSLQFEMDDLIIIESNLEKEKQILKGLKEKESKLFIKAKIDGQINDLLDIRKNQWVSKNEKIFSIVNLDQHQVVAFVAENDLYKINKAMQAQFKPNNNEFSYVDLTLSSIDMSAIEYLPYLSLASVHGGSIPVRALDEQNKLYKPEKAQYKVTFETKNSVNSLQWQTPGKVKLSTNSYSFFDAIYNNVSRILIRESGF